MSAVVVGFIVPATDADGKLTWLEADEEVIGAQMRIGKKAQGNGGRGSTGPASGSGVSANGWRGRNKGGVELADGRLVADALAETLGGVSDLLCQGTAGVVVVPEQSSDDHGGHPIYGEGGYIMIELLFNPV